VLSASPTGGTYTYQWNMNGNPVNGATSATYTASSAGNYNVEITDNASTCKAASTDLNVTVDALPLIDTTTSMVITPSNCSQSTGTIINVSVVPNNANNTYSWTDGSGNVVGTTINLNGVPAGNYCLAVTDSNSCSSNICGMTVTNAGAPTAPTLATPNNTYCQGQSVNPISVSGTGTITWYSDPALTTQVGSGTTYTPVVTGTVTYYVTADSNGCTSPALPVTITINTNPPAPLVSNPATYCQGQTIGTLTASGTGTIIWSTSPGMMPVINTGNTYTPTGLAIGTTTYYLIDSSSAGCKSQNTATTSVSISPSPLDPIVAAPSATYCQGDVIQPITTNGTGTILWYADAGHTQLVNTGTSFTPPSTTGSSIYYLLDSSAAGCKSVGTTTVTVAVNPVPATPLVSASSGSYCQGQNANAITASGTGTILWSANPGMNPVIATGNTFNPGTLPAGTTNYYLADSAAGCKSPVPAITSVIINPSPTISGNPTIDSAFCGLSTGDILNLNVNGGTPQYTYQWLNASGATVGTALNLNNAAAGTYTLIVVDANQCSDTSNTGYTIIGTSAVNAAFTPSTTQGPPTLNVNYTNGSTGATGYAWSLGDGTFSTQTNAQASYTLSGTYTVTMIASNGHCVDTASVLIVVDVPPVIIIPNVFTPNGDGTNDGFFIDSKGIRTLRCDIYNRWGQLVYTLHAPNDVWNGIMNNGNPASDGTYYYILDAFGYDEKEIKAEGYILLTR
ncbi:MAG: gliding motility-associated C-terminal domain-containing protein, partial [Bacteroidia bacterium]